jgi:hypothetical protein
MVTCFSMPARMLARLALVAAAVVAAAASGSTSQNSQPAVGNYNTSPPPPQAMDPALALGLWKSSFGAVKIENDDRGGPNSVHGVWVYDRQGTEVIGYFGGSLRGNVLDFTWEEPAADGSPLAGAGYLVFDPYGQRFTGRWWTQARDRLGEWTGWRQDQGLQPRGEPEPPPYGGDTYGDGYEPPPPPGY